MATKNFSAKEFTQVVKSAKGEVNGTFKSPFVIINLLNKAAKGDFTKVANCEGLSHENLAKVAKVVKALHGGRYAFDTIVFEKDYKGRFCTVSPFKGEVCRDYLDINGISALVATDSKGREVITCEDGKMQVFAPIALTVPAFFNAFAKVAKVDIIATEKAEKAEKAAAEKAEKEYHRTRKGILSDYNAGKFGEVELAEKLTSLREKYGK